MAPDGKYEVVQFGGRRSPRRRRLSSVGLACLVIAAIVAVVVHGSGEHVQDAAKTPHRPPPPIRLMVVGHPLLGVTAGWQLFVRGPDDLLRIQLAEGKISETYVPRLQTASADVAFVIEAHEVVIRPSDIVPGYVVPDGGEARQLTGPLAGDGPLIPGPAPAQAVWVTSGPPTSPSLSLVTLTGHRAGPTIRFPPDGPELPATAVSDGRGYVLVETGSFSADDAGPGWDQPVPGTVLAVGSTSWLVLACDAHLHADYGVSAQMIGIGPHTGHGELAGDPQYLRCRNEIVDIADGARHALPGPAVGYPYDFSWPPTGVIAPDGTTAAVAEMGRDGRLTVHLINLRSGADRNLKIPLGAPGDSLLLGADLNDQSMVWSPDSRWLFVVAAGGRLVAEDASTGIAEEFPAALPTVDQVAIRA